MFNASLPRYTLPTSNERRASGWTSPYASTQILVTPAAVPARSQPSPLPLLAAGPGPVLPARAACCGGPTLPGGMAELSTVVGSMAGLQPALCLCGFRAGEELRGCSRPPFCIYTARDAPAGPGANLGPTDPSPPGTRYQSTGRQLESTHPEQGERKCN